MPPPAAGAAGQPAKAGSALVVPINGTAKLTMTPKRLIRTVLNEKDTVARIWADHDLKPWQVDTFKISTDPAFEEKLVDVVGLYLNPPENAIVLCMDEKS